MIETKTEYIIETQVNNKEWLLSDYSLNEFDKGNLQTAKRLIKEARDTHQSTLLNFPTVSPRKYRLIKATTTFEVLDD